MERGHLEDLWIDGKIILKWFFKLQMGGCELDQYISGQEQVVGCCELGNDILKLSILCVVDITVLISFHQLNEQY